VAAAVLKYPALHVVQVTGVAELPFTQAEQF